MKWKQRFGRTPSVSELQDQILEVGQSSEPKVVQTFNAHALGVALCDLLGDVTITNGGPNITLTVHGRQSRIDTLQIETADDWFRITGDAESKGQGVNIFIGDVGKNVTVSATSSGGSITVRTTSRGAFPLGAKKAAKTVGFNLLDPDDRLEFTLNVPEGTKLSATGVVGAIRGSKAVLGDTHLKTTYAAAATLGTVNGLRVTTADSSTVEVDRIANHGDVRIKAGWDSRVRCKDGATDSLTIVTKDQADVVYGGSAQGCEIKAGWNARVTVQKADGWLVVKTKDQAAIAVNDGACGLLVVDAGWNAQVSCRSAASVAEISLKDQARCDIRQVGVLGAKIGWNAALNVDGDISDIRLVTRDQAQVRLNGHVSAGKITTGWNAVVRARSYGSAVVQRAGSGRIFTL